MCRCCLRAQARHLCEKGEQSHSLSPFRAFHCEPIHHVCSVAILHARSFIQSWTRTYTHTHTDHTFTHTRTHTHTPITRSHAHAHMHAHTYTRLPHIQFRHTLMLEVGALLTPNVKTARMLATCVSSSHHRPHSVITECLFLWMHCASWISSCSHIRSSSNTTQS